MIKTAIGSIIKAVISFALVAGGITYGFKHLHHKVKVAALTEVHKSLHSKNNLSTFTERMTGQKSWVDTPPPKKNILHGIGNWE